MADPKPDGRPMYDLMADWKQTLVYITAVGGEEWERQITAEIRQAMDELGVRVVLWYAERMQDVTAMMEEHGVSDEPHVEG